MRKVEGGAPGSNPDGAGEPHLLEVRTGGTAFDAPEAADELTARLMMLAKDAA